VLFINNWANSAGCKYSAGPSKIIFWSFLNPASVLKKIKALEFAPKGEKILKFLKENSQQGD
jgi:hypothetical protein